MNLLRRAAAALAGAALLLPLAAPPATAAGGADVEVNTYDGTTLTSFDPSESNGVLASNDALTYAIEVRANTAGYTGAMEVRLPAGLQVDQAPPWGSCQLTTPSPTKGVSYSTLAAQTLTCQIAQKPSETKVYSLNARLRPEVPNGATVGTTSVLLDGAVKASVAGVKAANQAKMQLGIGDLDHWQNFSDSFAPRLSQCASGGMCYNFSHVPIYGYTYPFGIGQGPMPQSFTYTLDLSATAVYGPAATSHPNWAAAGSGAQAKYAPRLVELSGRTDPTRSANSAGAGTTGVRDSGTPNVRDNGDGTYTVTVTGADLSAWSVPTTTGNGAQRLNPKRGHIYAANAFIQIPVEAVRDLGDGSALGVNLTMIGASGKDVSVNTDANRLKRIIKLDTQFGPSLQVGGYPGAVGNTPANKLAPTPYVTEGLPGSQTRWDGMGLAVRGQRLITQTRLIDAVTESGAHGRMVCLQIPAGLSVTIPDGSATSTTATGNTMPSNRRATWLSGLVYGGPMLEVEYSASADPDCAAGAWRPTPGEVSGTTPEWGPGVFPEVRSIRYMLRETQGTMIEAMVSTALTNTSTAPDGTPLGVTSAYSAQLGDTSTLAQAAKAGIELRGTYNPATAAGTFGDRALSSSAAGSMLIDTQGTAKTAGGKFKLTLTPGVVTYKDAPTDAVVRACLPKGFNAVPATFPAGTVATPGAGVCTGTELTWDAKGVSTLKQPKAISFDVEVSPTALDGDYTIAARTDVAGDPRTGSQRNANVTVTLASPMGARVAAASSVSMMAPADRDGSEVSFTATFANAKNPESIYAPVVYLELPKNGAAGSKFSGDAALTGPATTAARATIEYATGTITVDSASSSVTGLSGWTSIWFPGASVVRVTWPKDTRVEDGQTLSYTAPMLLTGNANGDVYHARAVAVFRTGSPSGAQALAGPSTSGGLVVSDGTAPPSSSDTPGFVPVPGYPTTTGPWVGIIERCFTVEVGPQPYLGEGGRIESGPTFDQVPTATVSGGGAALHQYTPLNKATSFAKRQTPAYKIRYTGGAGQKITAGVNPAGGTTASYTYSYLEDRYDPRTGEPYQERVSETGQVPVSVVDGCADPSIPSGNLTIVDPRLAVSAKTADTGEQDRGVPDYYTGADGKAAADGQAQFSERIAHTWEVTNLSREVAVIMPSISSGAAHLAAPAKGVPWRTTAESSIDVKTDSSWAKLAPGGKSTLTASRYALRDSGGRYAVLQQDVDSGAVAARLGDQAVVGTWVFPTGKGQSATARVSPDGRDLSGVALSPAAKASLRTSMNTSSTPAAMLTATVAEASGDGIGQDGEALTYRHLLVNTGTTTLQLPDTAVARLDAKLPAGAFEEGLGKNKPAGGQRALYPGEQAVILTSHAYPAGAKTLETNSSLTVGDFLSRTATTNAARTYLSGPSPSGLEVRLAAKDKDGDGFVEPGEQVTYTYTVRNNTDAPITAVALSAGGFPHAGAPFDLGPGKSREFGAVTVANPPRSAAQSVDAQLTATGTAGGKVTSNTAKTILPTSATQVTIDTGYGMGRTAGILAAVSGTMIALALGACLIRRRQR